MPLDAADRPVLLRWIWTVAMVLAFAAAAASAEFRGHASRRRFEPPPEFGGARWALVADAAEAVRFWSAAGVRGRDLVVLTGRWSPRSSREIDAARREGRLDADTALAAATEMGIVRRLTVVMPPRAWRRRLSEVRGAKQLAVSGGCFSLPYSGLARRFCQADAASLPDETALMLVEPSFLGEDGGPSPDVWARGRGLDVDLGVLTASDPVASQAQREYAAGVATALRAVPVEIVP